MHRLTKWRRTALLGSTALAVGALVGIAVLSMDRDVAVGVTVREDGTIIGEGSLDEALRKASERAGYQVVAPEKLPQGVQVREILVHPKPTRPDGTRDDSFGVVSLQLEFSGSKLLLDELKGDFNPILSGKELPNAVPGAKVYYDDTETAWVYSMSVSGRGFILGIPKDSPHDQAKVIQVLAAFADSLP